MAKVSPLHPAWGAPRLPEGLTLIEAIEEFKYLGIWISRNPGRYYARNLLPPLQRFKSDTAHWRSLPLTLLGRAALFKMKSLPRFLYALHHSPTMVPHAHFKDINATIRLLLWDNKPPRIALQKLTRGWYDWGIALPDLQKYYWAAHLAAINQCTYRPHDDPAFRLDRWLLPGSCFQGALYTKKINPPLTGPTEHAVQVWKLATKETGWEGKLTLATPLWHTDALGLLKNTKGFQNWDMIGISTIGDLWRNKYIITFPQLKEEHDLSDREHFRYSQIYHALRAVLPKGVTPPPHSPLEDRILDGELPERAISLIYKKLIHNTKDPLTQLRNRWDQDVAGLEDDDWLAAIASPREVAIPSTLRLIQLKILHRSYMSRQRLAKIGCSENPNCLRGCGQEGTFIHTLWECDYIQNYWGQVVDIMKRVVGKNIDCYIQLALLNVWGPTDLSAKERIWVTLGLMLAKRNIVRLWGAATVPTADDWGKDMD